MVKFSKVFGTISMKDVHITVGLVDLHGGMMEISCPNVGVAIEVPLHIGKLTQFASDVLANVRQSEYERAKGTRDV